MTQRKIHNSFFSVRELLTQGIDPNQGDDDGLTALHQSCIDDFQDLVKGEKLNPSRKPNLTGSLSVGRIWGRCKRTGH